ncbi:MAG: hypothetical protein HY268_30390 [Deltaproteobacteria bacterium]|nr:hypothetical protein [Deltaproteobacteria bacterium]
MNHRCPGLTGGDGVLANLCRAIGEMRKDLKKARLRYCCATSSESPSSVVDRALKEVIAKARGTREEKWFGLPAEDYLALAEEKKEALWKGAYEEELGKPRLPARAVNSRVVTPRQRSREALRRRGREIREKSVSHS